MTFQWIYLEIYVGETSEERYILILVSASQNPLLSDQ